MECRDSWGRHCLSCGSCLNAFPLHRQQRMQMRALNTSAPTSGPRSKSRLPEVPCSAFCLKSLQPPERSDLGIHCSVCPQLTQQTSSCIMHTWRMSIKQCCCLQGS